MLEIAKQLLKIGLHQMGLDIVRKSKSLKFTLLGLHNLHIRTVIDVGANEGQFAKMILGKFPDAHIYCFEPLPDPFYKLRKWAESKKDKNKCL